MSRIPPALVVELVVWLALSAFFYALWPYRRRALLTVVLATGLGLLLGQGWMLLGLPVFDLGDANIMPGVLFAAALQPVGERVPIRWP